MPSHRPRRALSRTTTAAFPTRTPAISPTAVSPARAPTAFPTKVPAAFPTTNASSNCNMHDTTPYGPYIPASHTTSTTNTRPCYKPSVASPTTNSLPCITDIYDRDTFDGFSP